MLSCRKKVLRSSKARTQQMKCYDEEQNNTMIPVSTRQVPLLDLQAQHKQIREEVLAEIERVVDSQKFILGEDVKKLEAELAPYCGAAHAIGCASGSDALL